MVMTRGINADTLAAFEKPFFPVTLALIGWPTGVIRVHDGLGSISFQGQSWLGVGDGGSIRLPDEQTGMASLPGEMMIGGTDTEIDDELRADVIGRPVQVYYGAVTQRAGATLIGVPFSAFTGTIDGVQDEQTADGRMIRLQLASGPSQRSRSSSVHSYADQIANGGDTAGRHVNAALSRSRQVLRW